MVSIKNKRCNNVYNESFSEDDDSDFEILNNNRIFDAKGKTGDYQSNRTTKRAKLSREYSSSDIEKKIFVTSRRPKAYNRNALMARENRIKKKMYLQNLEETVEKFRDENKKLSSILDNQSSVISDLRKEVKYLKNVLANSTDIGRLLKCINQNTGMPVTTSINSNYKINTTKETSVNIHPWAEKHNENEKFFQNNLPFDDCNGEFSTYLMSDLENDSIWNDFSDLHSSGNTNENIIQIIEDIPSPPQLYEHNYTSSSNLSKNEEAGVCLHIARHKVSLEFCSSCSENAATAWNED